MASIVHDEWPSTSKTASCIPPTNGYISTENTRHPRPPMTNQPYHQKQHYMPTPIPYYNVTWPAPAQIHPNYVNNLANGMYRF